MPASRRTRQFVPVAFLAGVIVLGLLLLLVLSSARLSVPGVGTSPGPGHRVSWPRTGQAAFVLSDQDDVVTSRAQRPVPIASVTRVMTALITLEQSPLIGGAQGFSLKVTAADVHDTDRRRTRDESVVTLHAGDTLSGRQALLALLLPSANNVAHMLAVVTAGDEESFVGLMNARARSLDMSDTTYADASGLDPSSRSTAHDQTLLAREAMRNPTFAWLVGQTHATLPTAGTILTTNRLLGRHGFVGLKTGSTTPAGGCFVFAAYREVAGRRQLVVGAVFGQRGEDTLAAAFQATEHLVDSVSEAARAPR